MNLFIEQQRVHTWYLRQSFVQLREIVNVLKYLLLSLLMHVLFYGNHLLQSEATTFVKHQ